MDVNTKSLRIYTQIVNGLKFPFHFNTDNIREALKLEPRDDDIFVVTYPKCGTFWTQYIVWSLQNFGKTPLPMPHQLTKIAPFIEIDNNGIECLPSPRHMKHHLPFNYSPYNRNAKYIYVSRNPRDCAVSYYNFYQNGIAGDYYSNCTFNDFFEQFIIGDLPFGDFFDHVISWYKHKDDDNVLFLFYEKMIADPYDAVLKIARFISDDKINYEYEITKNNNELLNKIVEITSFKNIKHMPYVYKRPQMSFVKSIDQLKHDIIVTKEIKLFRKGIIGDWNNYFNDQQIQRLNERCRIKTAAAGIKNVWKY